MAHAAKLTGTRDSFIEPTFPVTQLDPLRNYPIGHKNALRHYYLTKDVLIAGTERGKVPRTQNDVNFAIQREISKGQFSAGRSRPFDLVTMDYVNSRDFTAPTATSGLFTTSVDHAGTMIPVGTHAEPSASPSVHGFATNSTHLSGIAVVGLFRVDRLDADGRPGVFARGTAATDHWRVIMSYGTGTAQIWTRAGGADTLDASATSVGSDFPADEVSFLSMGASINANNTYIVVVNGTIVHEATLSAGAQALTGNAVGIHGTGVAPGTGVLLFQAIDLKVVS